MSLANFQMFIFFNQDLETWEKCFLILYLRDWEIKVDGKKNVLEINNFDNLTQTL